MEVASVLILIIAFVLDSILGDPRALPHLIVLYGKGISYFEKTNNNGTKRRFKGAVITLLLVTLSFAVPFSIIYYLNAFELSELSIVFSTIMLFYCLANRTLIKEGYAVFNVLHKEGLEAGRKRLSWIVGRDTSKLDEQQIRKATFETMSENLSDGVIAPLFFFSILGVPGAMAYKMINTLDSMIGYKNDKYLDFGRFAAKLDDVVNYIPARITTILMLVISFKWKGFRFVFKEGKKHSSPNAGFPEAALAYILDCQFGGPNIYHGKLVEKPFIGYSNRKLKHREIHRVAKINFITSAVFVTMIVIIFFLTEELI